MAVSTPLDFARQYLRRGWQPTPVKHRGKRPLLEGWQNRRLGEDDLPKHFNREHLNIGVLLGEPSGWLTDVDLDCRQAVQLASWFLPATAHFGRNSNPRSHWLYVCPGLPTTKYKSPDDGMILETRSTGGQTVFPGSIHEDSGEEIVWHDPSDPQLIDPEKLRELAGDLAASALLVRNWPSTGSRHEASLALAGGLARSGISRERAVRIMQAVAEVTGCDDVHAKLRNVADSYERVRNASATTGWRSLAELLGDKVVSLVRKWIGVIGVAGGDANGDRVESADPLPLAESFINAKHRDNVGRLLIRRWRREWWQYTDPSYRAISDEVMDADIYKHTERLLTPKRTRGGDVEKDEQGCARLVKVRPRRSLVSEVRAAMPSRGILLDDQIDVPCWLDGEYNIDAREFMPVSNGLLHLPSRELREATPSFFATHSLDYPYDRNAPPPKQWRKFLCDLWGDDTLAIQLLQEWFAAHAFAFRSASAVMTIAGPSMRRRPWRRHGTLTASALHFNHVPGNAVSGKSAKVKSCITSITRVSAWK